MIEKLIHKSDLFNYGKEINPIYCYYEFHEIKDSNNKVFYRRDKFTKRGDTYIKTSQSYSISYPSKRWTSGKLEFFKKHGIVK
jgi:hypothetical protein